MAEVIWRKRAAGQLERAVKYIRDEQGVAYAQIVLEKILQSVSNLKSQPKMGAREPMLLHKPDDYRYLVVWSYKVIYRVMPGNRVEIMRIFHTSRNPKHLK